MKKRIKGFVLLVFVASICVFTGYGLGYDNKTNEVNESYSRLPSTLKKKYYGKHEVINPIQIHYKTKPLQFET